MLEREKRISNKIYINDIKNDSKEFELPIRNNKIKDIENDKNILEYQKLKDIINDNKVKTYNTRNRCNYNKNINIDNNNKIIVNEIHSSPTKEINNKKECNKLNNFDNEINEKSIKKNIEDILNKKNMNTNINNTLNKKKNNNNINNNLNKKNMNTNIKNTLNEENKYIAKENNDKTYNTRIKRNIKSYDDNNTFNNDDKNIIGIEKRRKINEEINIDNNNNRNKEDIIQNGICETNNNNIEKNKINNEKNRTNEINYIDCNNIIEIPTVYASVEEISNPIIFFEKYNKIGQEYGAIKVIPPPFFKPQFNPYYLHMKFNIRRQYINKIKKGKGFKHPEEYWNFYEMYKYNELMEAIYFSSEQKIIENIEKKYWNIINNEHEKVVSVYGADLPVSKFHPTCLFKKDIKDDSLDEYGIDNDSVNNIANMSDDDYDDNDNYSNIEDVFKKEQNDIFNSDIKDNEKENFSGLEKNMNGFNNDLNNEPKIETLENMKKKEDVSINNDNDYICRKKKEYIKEINQMYVGLNENINIKSLPFTKGSMLRNIDILIEGVNIPWLYVGTLFSTFCWHTEDNYFASINYQHWGSPKIWYVIPPYYSEKVENIIFEYINQNKKDKKKTLDENNNINEKKDLNEKYDINKKNDINEKNNVNEKDNVNENNINKNNKNENDLNDKIKINHINKNKINKKIKKIKKKINKKIKKIKKKKKNKNKNKNQNLNLNLNGNKEMSTNKDNIYICIDNNKDNEFYKNVNNKIINFNNIELIYKNNLLKHNKKYNKYKQKYINNEADKIKKEKGKHKIYKLTIQIPIDVFIKNNIPVYKNVQRKNEYIFLWPKTFHGGFNGGFNCNEACNIAPSFWLFHGFESYYNYKFFRNTCMSIHFILFSNIIKYEDFNFNQLKHVIYSLHYVFNDELKFLKDNKKLFIDITLDKDLLSNDKIIHYSKQISLDLNKLYLPFEGEQSTHIYFEFLKSKLNFFYKDCDNCNSPTFNSAVFCPHSNEILCIHCYYEHSCDCKFKVVLKRYSLIEMMRVLVFLTNYANSIKDIYDEKVCFNDLPDYKSLKEFEDNNSIKLFKLIKESKNLNILKSMKDTGYYIDSETYCLERTRIIEGRKNKKKANLLTEQPFILVNSYLNSNHFKTKMTLKYFILTYEEEYLENPAKILPKIIT